MPRAPKTCNEPGCPNLVHDDRRRCDEHYQPWQGHKRHKGIDGREMRENTAEHKAFKKGVLQRCQYRCQISYPGICTGIATQVDRIDNHHGYTEDNCQGACVPCHRRKTSLEGHAARGHGI